MQLKTNPQIDALNKQLASRTTVQVNKNPQLDALNKPAASITTVQVNRNPQIDAINKRLASRTTVQVKSNPTLDALNKQAASKTTVQANRNPQLDALNKQAASKTTVQVKPNAQLDALNKPAASTTTVRLKAKPQLDVLSKRLASSEKYIPYVKKSKSGGGTLRIIEFFVVVIILTTLSWIALPSFLSCGNKAKQSEAKQYLSSMNRAQQAYFADKGAFSNSLTALNLGIKTQTINYNYSAIATKNAAFSYGIARSNNLRSYVGAVFLISDSQAAKNEKTTASILCETPFGNTQPSNPLLQNDVPVCADGTAVVPK